LAIGIGGTTAVFTVVNGVLLRPLPYPDSDRLVYISGAPVGLASRADLLFPWNQARSLAQVAAFAVGDANVADETGSERTPVAVVTDSFFRTIGVDAALGRLLGGSGGHAPDNVTVISDHLWHRDFNGSSGALGQVLRINGVPHTVIGVMPPGLSFPGKTELWIEWPGSGASVETRRAAHPDSPWMGTELIGRLQPAASLEQAQIELGGMFTQLNHQMRSRRSTSAGGGVRVFRMQDLLIGDSRPPIVMLFVATALVLLIVCLNSAGVLLTRAVMRQKEIGIMLALGASRSRVFGCFLAESILTSMTGSLFGIGLAYWATGVIRECGPPNIFRLPEVSVDWRVLLFAVAASILAGSVAGMAPALWCFSRELADVLKEGVRGGSGARQRFRKALLVCQIAVAVALTTGAGRMITSLTRLTAVDPGFRTENVVVGEITLPRTRYRAAEDRPGAGPANNSATDRILVFHSELLDRLGFRPEVTAVGCTDVLPLSGSNPGKLSIIIQGQKAGLVQRFMITGEYFRALGIAMLAGRTFTSRDAPGGQGVAIINQRLAKRFFEGSNPIGAAIVLEGETDPRVIVGVVQDVRATALDGAAPPQFYLPYSQPYRHAQPPLSSVIVIRTTKPSRDLAQILKTTVRSLDSDVPLSQVRTMRQVVTASVGSPRFLASLLAIFAVISVALAAFGIYGMAAYSVARRTHEIGVRLSVGARPRNVLLMILGEGMRLAGAGTILGLALAFTLKRSLASFVFGVHVLEPTADAAGTGLVLLAALAGSLIPAWRASRLNPQLAIRSE
jgi:putative ABC transport system permease protein